MFEISWWKRTVEVDIANLINYLDKARLKLSYKIRHANIAQNHI
jgi:hypothetical protein